MNIPGRAMVYQTEDYNAKSNAPELSLYFSVCTCRGRNFVNIPGRAMVYQTEDYNAKSNALYLPITQDIMLNMRNIEQVTFGHGRHFVSNEDGNYDCTKEGRLISKRYISYLFRSLQGST